MELCRDRVFYVATKPFFVVTKFWPSLGVSCHNITFYVVTEFGQDKKGFVSRQGILCRDRVLPRLEYFLSR